MKGPVISHLSIDDLSLSGKKVLVRSDLNVPIQDGRVADDFRLIAAIPALEALRAAGASVILCSHLGRPNGRVVDDLRLAPVAARLSELVGYPITCASDTVGEDATRLTSAIRPTEVVMLENTRFHPGEATNDPDYSTELAELADFFVFDAFGSAHRSHASTVGVVAHLPSAAGPLLVAELEAFRVLIDNPPRPFVVILGGAKIADKLPLIEALLPNVDSMALGGGMSFSLLAVEGYEVGRSLLDAASLSSLRQILTSERADRLVLPSDVVTAPAFEETAPGKVTDVKSIDAESWGLDIGPHTAQQFADMVMGAGAVFWNGPMGIFEWEQFRSGTEVVATAMANSPAFRVAGGGDSVAALRMLGLDDRLDHLSTGGGAGLTLLEGGPLPVVEALGQWVR